MMSQCVVESARKTHDSIKIEDETGSIEFLVSLWAENFRGGIISCFNSISIWPSYITIDIQVIGVCLSDDFVQ